MNFSSLKDIYNFGPFPTPMLSELRQKFSFNITPFQQLSTAATNPFESDNSKRTAVRTNSDDMKGQVDHFVPFVFNNHANIFSWFLFFFYLILSRIKRGNKAKRQLQILTMKQFKLLMKILLTLCHVLLFFRHLHEIIDVRWSSCLNWLKSFFFNSFL